MTPEAFTALGIKLYGPRWKSAFADTLEYDRKTVARWASGRTRIPPHVARAILDMTSVAPAPRVQTASAAELALESELVLLQERAQKAGWSADTFHLALARYAVKQLPRAGLHSIGYLCLDQLQG